MRNVKPTMLKKCIILSIEEFDTLVRDLTDGLTCVSYALDGFYYKDTEKAETTGRYYEHDITPLLEEYFDIEISSIHSDDYEMTGIWIVYKERSE